MIYQHKLGVSKAKKRILASIVAFALIVQPLYGFATNIVIASGTVSVSTQAELVNELDNGSSSIIELSSDFTSDSQIEVDRPVTLNGNNHTIATSFSGSGNGDDSILLITSSDVTLNNLIVDGGGGSNLQGIQVYTSTNVTISNSVIKNNDKSGIHANGSVVSIVNVTTSGNGESFGGIHLGKGGGVTTNPIVTISGQSIHDEPRQHIYNSVADEGSVNDTNSQYDSYGGIIYVLKPTLQSPSDGATIDVDGPIIASWNKVTSSLVSGYEYRVAKSETIDSENTLINGLTFTKSGNSNNFHDGAGTVSGTYYWQVRSVYINGIKGSWSLPWKAIVAETTPTTPTNLRLVVDGEELECNSVAEVNLATALWDNAANASSYEYEVTYTGITVYYSTLTTNSNTGAFGGGQNGDWSFRVRSVSTTGDKSDWSDYCNVVLDTENPVAAISGVSISEDQQKLGFTLTATDTGTGIKHVAANIYNASNSGEALIKLGQNASGGTSGTTRLNVPYTGLDAGIRSETWSLNDIDISSLAPGTYTIRAFARDQLGRQHRFATHQFTINTPTVTDPEEIQNEVIAPLLINGGASTTSGAQPQSINTPTAAGAGAAIAFQASNLTNDNLVQPTVDDGEVEGDSDEAEDVDAVEDNGNSLGASDFLAQNAATQKGNGVFGLFGIAWYWILGTLAGISTLWWLLAGRRRKDDKQV